MDWRTVNFDWNRARAVLVTAEEGSFSAAARALGMAQPTIGRQVAALEAELDVTLFERAGDRRGLQLTRTGLELIEHLRAMGDAATRLSMTAAGHSLSLDGPITITASEVISAFLLPPLVRQIRGRHPGIQIEIVATNDTTDLSRREADIAIRSFKPTQPDLVTRKIKDSDGWLYASPDYLDSVGNPSVSDDLTGVEFFAWDHTDMLLNGLNALGLSLTPENFKIVSGSHLVQWEYCKRGLGICVIIEEIGDAEPAVVRAIEGLPPISVPMWLTSHRELRTSRRVRVVFDLLAEGLA